MESAAQTLRGNQYETFNQPNVVMDNFLTPKPVDNNASRPMTYKEAQMATPRTQQEQSTIQLIQELKKSLCLELKNIRKEDILRKLNIDKESIESFNEFAGYLNMTNPICSGKDVDTVDKLISQMGI